MTLHLELLAVEDPHHGLEAAFKACGRALAAACRRIDDEARVLTTKGLF
jgi:imidazoleglycerol phosphate dehydratase HisB